MADIPLTQVAGDKTYFVSEGISSGTITLGQTGNLLSVAESGSKVYRIFLLTSLVSGQVGISLTVNGTVIESEKELVHANSADSTQFAVIRNFVNISSPSAGLKVYDVIECTSFSVDKNAGNTGRDIVYAYEIGEYV